MLVATGAVAAGRPDGFGNGATVMESDVKRIIVAAALAAAAFNAAAPAKRAGHVASWAAISANPGTPTVPETLPVRPNRVRIERCGGASRPHGKIEAPLFGD